MNASPSVAAVAIALMLASLVILAGEAIQVVGAVHILQGSGQPLSAFVSARPIVFLALPVTFSLLGLVAAVGLLASREWGRRTVLFLATVPVTIYSFLVLFQPIALFGRHGGGGILTIGNLALSVCVYALLLFVPLSLWWLILLTREGIRSQFR